MPIRAQRRPGISPGDTRRASSQYQPPRRSLNEGRGISPGDTRTARPSTPSTPPLNEGRGISPGDTHALVSAIGSQPPRSTKAGASAPATQRPTVEQFTGALDAQRRPGHQPRRHRHQLGGRTALVPHAQRRPGHQPRRHLDRGCDCPLIGSAQRRPGHQPRRHSDDAVERREARERSTKAGASAPATPTRDWTSRRSRRTLNEGRGISPGDTPAPLRDSSRSRALNEGRGISPGDTAYCGRSCIQHALRALNEGRGISPGDTRTGSHRQRLRVPPSAQRRPGHQPRRHSHLIRCLGSEGSRRSTKAGASAPATLLSPPMTVMRSGTLNEGRGISPGDTASVWPHGNESVTAQRRPGHQPRRHRACAATLQ